MPSKLKNLRRRVAPFLLRESDISQRPTQAERQLRQNTKTLSGLRLLMAMAPADLSSLTAEMGRF